MKTISVVIACYNEEDNIKPLIETLTEIMTTKLSNYDYELICVDNDSKDKTQERIRECCKANPKVKAIFNTHNFGSIRSASFGLLKAKGDLVVKMCADFQDPPELIPEFVKEHEKGHRIVLAIKNEVEENKLTHGIRQIYYKMIRKITDIEHIDNYEGFGLYDREFIEVFRQCGDPIPYFRGIVAELGFKHASVYYHKPQRKSGKSKFNFYRLYDYAMIGITSYSKVPMRIASFAGMIIAGLSFIVGLVYLVMKLIFWNRFSTGIAPALIGSFFIGAIQLMFLGLLGDYISTINTRVMNRPLVTVEEYLNMEENNKEQV